MARKSSQIMVEINAEDCLLRLLRLQWMRAQRPSTQEELVMDRITIAI